MSEPRYMDVTLPDVPAIVVTTGRDEVFIFADDPALFDGPPKVTGLGAAVLVTRLRWWADRIERDATEHRETDEQREGSA